MLPPDNRRVLLELLRPPAGSTLVHAVTTTFTLDLTAALVAPLAFASHRLHGRQDPIAVMEAVRSAADNIDIFCQAGHIGIPARHSDLMAFVEGAVHEVRPPRAGRLFHPKLWLLHYFSEDEGDGLRLVVTSRNLTDDVSWDAAVRLDGYLATRPFATNAPLANLIRQLPGMARDRLPTERARRIEELADLCRYVEWEPLEPGGEPTFHVFGLDGPRPKPDFSGYRHLIVSPFINDEGLRVLVPGSRESQVTVVSRPEQMEQLDPDTVARLDETSIISPLAGLTTAVEPVGGELEAPDGEGDTSEERSLLGGGLHAKLYVVERNRAAYVFIGSANATDAAFGGNVEILLEFRAGSTKMGVDVFLDDKTGMFDLLEEYSVTGGESPDPEQDAIAKLENRLRAMVSKRWSTEVRGGPEAYELVVQGPERLGLPDDVTGSVGLLSQPGRTQELATGGEWVFPAVPLADVTSFLALSLRQDIAEVGRIEVSTVVRSRLVNDPSGRLDAVLARQVDTPEKFLRFLFLLLGLSEAGALAMNGQQGSQGAAWGHAGRAGTLEAIVRALADHPAAIDDLDTLVARLRRTDEGRRILPQGFDELWDVVLTARRRLPPVLTTRSSS